MKNIVALLVFSVLLSCGNDTIPNQLIVKGNIKGLKKGTVYLKKAKDSTLVTLDSLELNGNSNFKLTTKIDTPEVLFLYLNKNASVDSRISFFANEGVTEINTSLKNFVYDSKISGSKQQDLLNDYNKMVIKFNNQGLDLLKENFEAAKIKDTALYNKTGKAYSSLEKRFYLYTTNFALTNKNSEVAPYLALSQLSNANIKLIDTVYTSLDKNIKASIYGKELKTYLDAIKK